MYIFFYTFIIIFVYLYLIYLVDEIDNTDPIEHCQLYKDKDCPYVDGLYCDINDCTMLKKYLHEQHNKHGRNN